ncbi:hypothetical protein GQ457_05G025440 [Hibiscus cannabinus]
MVLSLRENRFNAISESDANIYDDTENNTLTRQQSLVTTKTTAPLVFRARQKVKGKSVMISKTSSGTHVRKPLTLSDFPVLSRNSHKGGSSKSVPPQVVSLDASKHYVVVINENSDVNVQQPMQQASDPPHMQQHLLGEPPDLNSGIGGNSEPNAVISKTLDITVVADDHSHELGGNHAIAMLE